MCAIPIIIIIIIIINIMFVLLIILIIIIKLCLFIHLLIFDVCRKRRENILYQTTDYPSMDTIDLKDAFDEHKNNVIIIK